jgi:hypothetical protein
LFAKTVTQDGKGREKKLYDEAMVPYEKLKQIDNRLNKSCLKPGVSLKQLDGAAYRHSDNQFAALMRAEEKRLFATIQKITTTKLGSRRKKKI